MMVPVRILALLMAAAVVTACATSSLGDKLGVDVHARASQIQVEWDELHAWAPAMARGGELVAEYDTADAGLVREVVARSPGAAARRWQFDLPQALRAPPTGAVCLYLQVPSQRSLLPVRKPGKAGEDTARFFYPEWDQAVRSRSAANRARAELALLQAQSQEIDGVIAARKEALAKRGWVSEAACASAGGGAADAVATQPPVGVVPREQHDAAARQVCVFRAQNAQHRRQRLIERFVVTKDTDFLEAAAGSAGVLDRAAEAVLQMKAGEDGTARQVLTARQQDARVVLDDWRRYGRTMPKGYYPAFGAPSDGLPLIGGARGLHTRLILIDNADKLSLPTERRPQLSANELLSLSGSMLDAYKGCVDDGKRELKTKLDTWTELQRDTPERARRIRDYYAQECRVQHQQLTRWVSERDRLLAEAVAVGGRAASVGDGSRAGLVGVDRSLNHAVCP